MQRAGVPMLYDSASNPRLPCLYICPVANVLGSAPLIPCFIGGNRDSSGWRAPAVDDTESVEDHFIELRPAGPASVHSRSSQRREDRARAVEETGPRGRHGATQEPHSAPAQDA